jgi:hypothetical protein
MPWPPFRLHPPDVPRPRFVPLPLSAERFPRVAAGMRLRTFEAGSSLTSGRIEFVLLRTGGSPSMALHLASRRRSYRWVRAGERLPGEDLHLSVMAPLQAHFVSPRCARLEGAGDTDTEPTISQTRFGLRISRALGTAGRTAGHTNTAPENYR